MLEEFRYESYRRLLQRLRASHENLTFVDFPHQAPPSRYFILRHDVDYSPEAALRMARLEAGMGVRATYFLLFTVVYYNLLSDEHCRFPRDLVALGHDVGLHYDLPVLSRMGTGGVERAIELQARLLEDLAGAPVRSISLHNPSTSGEDPLREGTRFVNAYGPEHCREGAYFSDSFGAWRPETLRRLESGDLPPRFQLLIHPLFWDEEHADRRVRLERVVEKAARGLRERAACQKQIWTVFLAARGARPPGKAGGSEGTP